MEIEIPRNLRVHITGKDLRRMRIDGALCRAICRRLGISDRLMNARVGMMPDYGDARETPNGRIWYPSIMMIALYDLSMMRTGTLICKYKLPPAAGMLTKPTSLRLRAAFLYP